MEYKKPYKLIKDANKVVNELKEDLKYSKDKIKDAKRINNLLDALKGFNDMLSYRYKTDVVDTLILALIYEYLLIYKAYENEVPIHQILNHLDFSISNGTEQKKKEVISILKTHEMKNKIENNSVFEKDYINFDVLINDLLNQIKTQIKWSLIK